MINMKTREPSLLDTKLKRLINLAKRLGADKILFKRTFNSFLAAFPILVHY